MTTREAPPGAELAALLSLSLSNYGDGGKQTAIEDIDAERLIRRTYNTTMSKANDWLIERRDDGSLGWSLLTVDGATHALRTITSAEGPAAAGASIYVWPPYVHSSGIPVGFCSARQARSPGGLRARQGASRRYWSPDEAVSAEIERVRAEQEAERAERQQKEQALDHLAAPLRSLLAAAGAGEGRVSVVPGDERFDDSASVHVFLQQADAERLNAYLSEKGT